MVNKSISIQYDIQPFLYGCHDDFNDQSTISVAARLDQLRVYWSRWSRLEPAETTVARRSGTLGTNEFVDGIFGTVVGK